MLVDVLAVLIMVADAVLPLTVRSCMCCSCVLQVVIDYPTTSALTQFITKQLLSSGAAAATAAATAAAAGMPATAGQQMQPTRAAMPLHPGQPLQSPARQQAALVVLGSASRSPVLAVSASGAQDPVGLVPLDRWDVEADATASTSARYLLC